MNNYCNDILAAMAERTIKRLWIIIIILIALFFGSNLAWTIYEMSYVTEKVTQEIDTGRGNAFVVGIGDLDYGTRQADDTAQDAENG